jgi:putative transposase
VHDIVSIFLITNSNTMSKFPRLIVPEYPHHITQRGVRRQRTFFDALDYQTYLDLALELTEDFAIRFWAYCLMPNHIHAVVVPEGRDALSKYFAILHRRYAWRINRRYEWTGHLWQKRFFSVVMEEPHAVTALRYAELNPVRAGICTRPEEWAWSSARGNLGLHEDPLIDRSRTEALVPNWQRLLTTEEDPVAVQTLRAVTGTGRPEGSDRFLKSIESQTGRRVRKKRPGRKKK